VSYQREFFKFNGYSVASDRRDVELAGYLDADVYIWCRENKIDAEINTKLDHRSIWRIKDDQHRAWFILRWNN